MADQTPSNPRLRRAAIIVIALVVVIVVAVFVTFNIAHYRAMENETVENRAG